MKDFKFNENNIFSLWQNEIYNNVPLIFYSVINKYLWTGEIKISNDKLVSLSISRKDFENFVIKYINELTKILYKQKNKQKYYTEENLEKTLM